MELDQGLLINDLKGISIRSRLAYGASCVENALRHFGIRNELLENKVLPLIWEFTTSCALNEWDDAIRNVDPIDVLNENDPANPLLSLYQTLPSGLVEMIGQVFGVGVGNLYGGTGDHSPSTLEALISVVQKCIALKIPLPVIDVFKKSPFSEVHGWGIARDRDFFKTSQ